MKHCAPAVAVVVACGLACAGDADPRGTCKTGEWTLHKQTAWRGRLKDGTVGKLETPTVQHLYTWIDKVEENGAIHVKRQWVDAEAKEGLVPADETTSEPGKGPWIRWKIQPGKTTEELVLGKRGAKLVCERIERRSEKTGEVVTEWLSPDVILGRVRYVRADADGVIQEVELVDWGAEGGAEKKVAERK